MIRPTASSESSKAAVGAPVVASYCATFLKPEMLHIYRQIQSLERVRPVVIAQKREEASRFPFSPLEITGRPPLHFLRRFWFRKIRHAPWQISQREVNQFREILQRHDAQLLHIYFGHIAVHLLPLIRAWEKPVVVSFHGADVLVEMQNLAYRAATAQMLAAVSRVLVRSHSLRKAVIELGCSPDKIHLQRTGIPWREIPARARIWPTDGAWRFVQACRLIEKKGLRTSLRAFAKFTKRYPRSTFTIAGDGPLRDELRDEAKALDIGEKVSFSGFVRQNELRELFYASHIFLHPSEIGPDGNQEGVPNSMLEAMASGLPVFATAHGGIPEAIENRVSGILVEERDDRALSAALLEMVATPERLAEMARQGTLAVAEKFDQQTQTRHLENIYLEARR